MFLCVFVCMRVYVLWSGLAANNEKKEIKMEESNQCACLYV